MIRNTGLITRTLPFLYIMAGLLAAGCNDVPLAARRTPNLPGDPAGDPNRIGDQAVAQPPLHGAIRSVAAAPGSAEAKTRVAKVGQQLIERNPQYGLRPMFWTAGLPDPEIVHQGTGLIMITESMVAQCHTDDQLAAVLSLELGKMIAEREAQQAAARRLRDRPEPMSIAGGPGMSVAGPPDHTQQAEMVKMYGDHPDRMQPANLPNPETLAHAAMTKAGYNDKELETVRDLLKAADANTILHKQYNGQPSR